MRLQTNHRQHGTGVSPVSTLDLFACGVKRDFMCRESLFSFLRFMQHLMCADLLAKDRSLESLKLKLLLCAVVVVVVA